MLMTHEEEIHRQNFRGEEGWGEGGGGFDQKNSLGWTKVKRCIFRNKKLFLF